MPASTPSPAPRPAEQKGPGRAGRLVTAQAAALLAMVGAFTLLLPWKLLALPCALAALVLGVLAWRAAPGAPRPTATRAAASAGTALALLGVLGSALPLLAWQETADLEHCTASALTARAQQACSTDFADAVQRRTGMTPTGG